MAPMVPRKASREASSPPGKGASKRARKTDEAVEVRGPDPGGEPAASEPPSATAAGCLQLLAVPTTGVNSDAHASESVGASLGIGAALMIDNGPVTPGPGTGCGVMAPGRTASAGAAAPSGQRAAFNKSCPSQHKIILEAAALWPSIGQWLPGAAGSTTRTVENVGPSKKKGLYVDNIVKECAESQTEKYPNGFTISKRSLEGVLPVRIEEWLKRQDIALRESGNGDSTADDAEIDGLMETLIESLAQQQNRNEDFKTMSAAQKDQSERLDNMATDQRQAGMMGMAEGNRSSAPRAPASARSASSRGGGGGGGDDESDGSEEYDAAQVYARGREGRGSDGGAGKSIDNLVAVLSTNADTAREDKEAQRGLDARRLDNDARRIEIESEKEARLSKEVAAKVDRDLLRDNARITAEAIVATRADADRVQTRTMMDQMMQIMAALVKK